MYVVTSIPLVRRTRQTLRSAEFGFFGVVVYTRVHTPRFCGQARNAGDAVLAITASRPLRTNCWIVGMGKTVVAPRFKGSRSLAWSSPLSRARGRFPCRMFSAQSGWAFSNGQVI